MPRKIQDADIKGTADVTSDSSLPNDNKIFINTFSKRFDEAIVDGDIGEAITIEEEDGAPTGILKTLKVTNGSLTDNGSGSFSLDTSGGGGAGAVEGAFFSGFAGTASTATKVATFTTSQQDTTGTLVTISNSATNGFTVTANVTCEIKFAWSFFSSGNVHICVGFNAGVTTDAQDLAEANRLLLTEATVANQAISVAAFKVAVLNDVFTPHMQNFTSGNNARCSLTITVREI